MSCKTGTGKTESSKIKSNKIRSGKTESGKIVAHVSECARICMHGYEGHNLWHTVYDFSSR